MAATIAVVSMYETIGGSVAGLVYEVSTDLDDPGAVEDTKLVNAVKGLDAQQPIPHDAFTQAAREGFPFAPTFDPQDWGGRNLAQVENELVLLDHHIADVWPDRPSALYPEKATPTGKQFLIRWCF